MARRRTRGPALAWVLPALALGCAALLALPSCSPGTSLYLVGPASERRELRELLAILDGPKTDPIERFAAVRRISSLLVRDREYGRLALLLTDLVTDRPQDPYVAYYLFAAAHVHDLQGSAPIAAIYYERIVKNYPDLEVEGSSLHYQCLRRLIDTVDDPERRIEYYKDLIARFSDRVDMGTTLFLLGKEYEKVGEWDLAVKTYAKFLPFFGASIPGYPDAFQYARNVVDFYNSSKDWTYEDLDVLLAKVRSALAAGDPYRLRTLRAKVNFFAMSWHQDETDVNSQVLFDFTEFMSGGRIYAADALDEISGPRDAYLRTTGWSERISTWYLYFRKIYFPADPEIHGRWEWAGIYFGEKYK